MLSGSLAARTKTTKIFSTFASHQLFRMSRLHGDPPPLPVPSSLPSLHLSSVRRGSRGAHVLAHQRSCRFKSLVELINSLSVATFRGFARCKPSPGNSRWGTATHAAALASLQSRSDLYGHDCAIGSDRTNLASMLKTSKNMTSLRQAWRRAFQRCSKSCDRLLCHESWRRMHQMRCPTYFVRSIVLSGGRSKTSTQPCIPPRNPDLVGVRRSSGAGRPGWTPSRACVIEDSLALVGISGLGSPPSSWARKGLRSDSSLTPAKLTWPTIHHRMFLSVLQMRLPAWIGARQFLGLTPNLLMELWVPLSISLIAFTSVLWTRWRRTSASIARSVPRSLALRRFGRILDPRVLLPMIYVI